MSYNQHVGEEEDRDSGKFSIKAIVDKFKDGDKPGIENVCTSACIFDLKAGRDIIKSKSQNSESKGFPTIDRMELRKALEIAQNS